MKFINQFNYIISTLFLIFLSIRAVAFPPYDIILSSSTVDENQPINTVVGTLSTLDFDFGDTFIYTLVPGDGDDDNASFTISGDNLLTSEIFNHEVKSSYSVRIQTDDGTDTYQEAFTITINDVNEAPTDITLSSSTIDENRPANTVVGTFTTTDPDVGSTFTYTKAVGAGDDDNASFNILGSQLRINAPFDFETKNSYSIRIRSTDNGTLWIEEQFIITVTNVNEAPVINSNGGGSSASIYVSENSIAVTTVTATDVDVPTTLTYSITGGSDDEFFSIGSSTGILTFLTAPNFENPEDANENNIYNVTVTVSDGTLTDAQAIAVTVQNVNEAPVITSNGGGETASLNVNENNTAVTIVTATDVDVPTTLTYSKTGGADQSLFSINSSSGALTFVTAPNFENPADAGGNNVYDVQVTVTDNGIGNLTDMQAIAVSVQDINEAPTDITLIPSSIAEGLPINTVVGTFTTTDPEGNGPFTYTKASGGGDDDNASFNILGDQLRSSEVFDLETQSEYSIRVRSTDAGGLFYSESFIITITNVNDAPVLSGIETSTRTYVENAAPTQITNTIQVVDADDTDLESATVAITSGYQNGEDTLTFTNANGITGAWSAATGTMTLTGTSLVANYRSALRNVRYANTSENPSIVTRVISFTVNDGDVNSNTVTRNLSVTAENDPPVLSGIETSALTYIENDVPTQITSTILVVDADDTQLVSATVRITSGYQNGQDTLTFTNANGITGTWNPSTGRMSLAGTSLVANYQSALRNVRYANTSENPSAVTRVISFTVNDGDINSNTVTRSLSVTPQNDPPVASEAVINGTHTPFRTRELLTEDHTYTDPENNPESGTTFKWFTANNDQGAGMTQIPSAVSDTFTTRFDDGGKYISIVVIPRDLPGLIGDDDTSAWYYINAAPELQNLIVVNRLHPGAIAVGEKVSADYNYYDKEGNPPGAHQFQWYRSNTGSWTSATAISGATDSTYTVQTADNTKHIAIEAYPYATAGSSPGERTRSSWYTVGTLPTAVISGSDSICNTGMNAELTVTLTGENPPWAFKYTINGANETEVTGVTQLVYPLIVTQVGTYVLTEVSDEKFSHGNVSGTGRVSLYPHPTAVFTEGTSVCEELQNKLNISLTGKSPWTVTYRYESESPVTIPNIILNPYDLPVANLGDYTLISVSDANCPGTATGTLSIIPAPAVTISLEETIYYSNSPPDTVNVNPFGGNFDASDSPLAIVPIGGHWLFYPQIAYAVFGSPFWIRYAYQDPGTSCVGKDSVRVFILQDAAEIQIENEKSIYCFNDDTIEVFGLNIHNNIGHFTITSNEGLLDMGDNRAYIFPSIIREGYRTVTYTVNIGGEDVTVEKLLFFGYIDGDFTWDNECFTDQSVVNFSDASVSQQEFVSYLWNFYMPDDTITSDTSDVSITFNDLRTYDIELIVTTQHSDDRCYDTIRKQLSLKPTYAIIHDMPYEQDFSDGVEYWSTFSVDEEGRNNWTFGRPDEGAFNADPGEKAWYTHITELDSAENSFVISPCFDFTHAERPMIKMDIWRAFYYDYDGAVLQYTENNGVNWLNVGTTDDGLNWYNSFNIPGNPGGQKIGWTREDGVDTYWVDARHKLDNLKSKTNVRFRIAYGAPQGLSSYLRNGIAFDDFWIGERTKKVLLEHFTNAGDANSKDADEALNAILNQDENKNDIINIQYHVGHPGPDPFYDLNPGPPYSREQYYEISSIPYGIIDGGRGNDPDFLINYLTEDLNQNDLTVAALEDNSFTIDIQAIKGGNSLDIDIDLISLDTLGQKYLTLHTVIIENLVTDITGENGETNFESVMKAMLPNSIGTPYNRSWSVGATEEINLHYDYKDVFDENELRVVVFVQDEETKTVYQAEIHNPNFPYGVDPYTGRETRFTVFPNPASSSVYIKLDRFEAYDLKLEVLNSEGRIIFIQKIQQGKDSFEIPLQSLEAGLYFVRLTTREQILGTEKLIYLGNK